MLGFSYIFRPATFQHLFPHYLFRWNSLGWSLECQCFLNTQVSYLFKASTGSTQLWLYSKGGINSIRTLGTPQLRAHPSQGSIHIGCCHCNFIWNHKDPLAQHSTRIRVLFCLHSSWRSTFDLHSVTSCYIARHGLGALKSNGLWPSEGLTSGKWQGRTRGRGTCKEAIGVVQAGYSEGSNKTSLGRKEFKKYSGSKISRAW